MQRKIKFRGKVKWNGNHKFSGDWVYGYYRNNDNGNAFITETVDDFDNYIFDETEVDENTVGQYTGLKDKNENEIYEGDIIDFSYDMFVGNFNTFVAKGIIIFEEGAFYVQCLENENLTKDESYLIYTINIDTIEIIGNIYDNPELLKKEK